MKPDNHSGLERETELFSMGVQNCYLRQFGRLSSRPTTLTSWMPWPKTSNLPIATRLVQQRFSHDAILNLRRPNWIVLDRREDAAMLAQNWTGPTSRPWRRGR